MNFDCFVEGLADECGGGGPSAGFVSDVIFHCCTGVDLEFSLESVRRCTKKRKVRRKKGGQVDEMEGQEGEEMIEDRVFGHWIWMEEK